MSDRNWNSIKVIENPLCIIFFDKSGNAKGAKGDVLRESEKEWKNISLAEGRVPAGDREPFFTEAETAAAKRALFELGIRLD